MRVGVGADSTDYTFFAEESRDTDAAQVFVTPSISGLSGTFFTDVGVDIGYESGEGIPVSLNGGAASTDAQTSLPVRSLAMLVVRARPGVR